MDTTKKQFLSKLQGLSYSRSTHQIFSDWLEIAALTLHQLPYHSGELVKDVAFETLEAQYMEHIKPYSRDELTVFSELLGLRGCFKRANSSIKGHSLYQLNRLNP